MVRKYYVKIAKIIRQKIESIGQFATHLITIPNRFGILKKIKKRLLKKRSQKLDFNKQKEELNSFQKIWEGGFICHDSEKRNQVGLEEYLLQNISQFKDKNVLEIGCGRGRWSKFISEKLQPKSLSCVDALSAEHNNFWEYVGEQNKGSINYYQVFDFLLDDIPDNSIDYVFSYDVWCHISLSGQFAYLRSLQRKCRQDAKLLIMYADPHKYYRSEPENFWFIQHDLPAGLVNRYTKDADILQFALDDCNGDPRPGRWYWVGMENFLENCRENGYLILKEDLNIDKTNVISLIQKK